MNFITKKTRLTRAGVDVTSVFLFEEKDALEQAASFLPPALKRECILLGKRQKFNGQFKKVFLFQTHNKVDSFLIVFIGLGSKPKEHESVKERLRECSALATQTANHYSAKQLGVFAGDIFEGNHDGAPAPELVSSVVEGVLLGSYTFHKYKFKKKEQKKSLKEVQFFYKKGDLKQAVKRAHDIAAGVILTRDIVNEPGGAMIPKDLLKVAESIARKSKSITLEYFDKKKLKKGGFGGILAVSQGSVHEPYLIHLIYKPSTTQKSVQTQKRKKIAIVGKGITFDSGGLSIKPSGGMETMKSDMAGAGAVLGLFSVLPRLGIGVEVHGIVPASENMPSGEAFRPGDIITIKNGKTVEVLNTDAEGRIVLADAFSYALEKKMDYIIDLATLTGSCLVALGSDIAGVLGNNQELVDSLLKAGKSTGEKLWQLPLEQKYQELMKSNVADLRNISTSRYGGTITAALFLQNFVGKTPWAHLDIAGPSFAEKPLNAYTPKGGTGFGVRTLVEYLEGV